MVNEIAQAIVKRWELFEPLFGQRPSRVDFLVQSGWLHRGQSVIIYFFKDKDRRPFCVGKVANDPETNWLHEHEFNSMLEFENTLSPATGKALPRLFCDLVVCRRFCFVLEWVDREKPLRNPWLSGRTQRKYAIRMSEWLREFQRETHSGDVTVDEEFLEANLLRGIAQYRLAYPALDPTEEDMLLDLDRATRTLKGTTLPVVSVHGDFCNQNVCINGRDLKAIDWMFSKKEGMFFEDVLMMLMSQGVDIGQTLICESDIIRDFFVQWSVPFELVDQIVNLFLISMATREQRIYGESYSSDSRWRRLLIELFKKRIGNY